MTALFQERWLQSYVGRKLRSDPIFPAAFDLLRESDQPILDVGCGVGLLSFYLRERNFLLPITGLDRDGRKIERALTVASNNYRDLTFIERDVCESFSLTGTIVLFDLLHYLAPTDQTNLLDRLARQVAPGGLLAIRDCPRDRNARFWMTNLAECFAQMITWNLSAPLHFPPRERIFAAFPETEFSRNVRPLWGGTPFNNHLFIFRRHGAATAPATATHSETSPPPER